MTSSVEFDNLHRKYSVTRMLDGRTDLDAGIPELAPQVMSPDA